MLKRVWPVLLLLCVSVSIAFFNVQKGTWLIGWDSTQPELNFSLNLSRGLSAVWQEYRGLGVTDGMAHSANLIHLVYAWVLAQIVGTAYVRYAYILLAHLLGGVGIYVLLRYLGRSMRGGLVSRWVSLTGALFYMLNPFTQQMFYQPLELFVTHFAALPWLTFTLIQYVSKPSKRNLGWFALANILTLPQAHVPTLFIVWMMLAGLLLLPALLWRTKRYGKQIFLVILVSIGIHGFWGFPYVYSAINNAKNIGEAKINMLSNPEVLLRNDAYGDVNSVAKMQGFSLSFEDWNTGYKYGLQMPEWVDWWGQQWASWVMGGMLILAGMGIVMCMVQRKWWMIGVVFMYALALGNLGAQIPYVREIGAFLRENIPYFEAIFRFTFTKFSLVYAFVFTILMVVGILGLYRLARGWLSMILSVAVIVGIVAVAWPIWQGQFFYHNLQLSFTGDYQSLYKFFNGYKDGRVLPLPYPDFWGWQSNEWGYKGSGFLWQGIANPTLYGAFNAWSPYNEGFYNEFSNALYGDIGLCSSDKVTRCHEQIEQTLQKYDVRYVLLDESVIAPGQGREILRIDETKKMAGELGWKQTFQDGFLTVWEVSQGHSDTVSQEFVSAPASYTWVDADTSKVRIDSVWEQVGTYVSDNRKTLPAQAGQGVGESDNQKNQIIYPFSQLMREEAKGVEYGEKETIVSVTAPQLHSDTEMQIVIPGWQAGDIVRINYGDGKPVPAYTVNGQSGPLFLGKEKPEDGKSYIVARVSEGKEWEEYREESRFMIQESRIEIKVEGTPFVYDFAKQGQGTIGNCDVLKRGRAEKQGASYVADERGAVCDYIVMPEIDTRLSYLMRMVGENKAGRSLKLFLYNTGSKRNDIEYLLNIEKFDQTFSLLPWSFDGTYTLNVETRSFGQYAENAVSPVEVRWLPLEQIAGAKIVPVRSDLVGFENDLQPTRSDLQIAGVKKYGTWLYIVETKNGGLLKLSQGYDEGWVSPWVEHVKVDGWANGWMVPAGEQQIVIFYWPQLLEYLGFVLLGVTVAVIMRSKQ